MRNTNKRFLLNREKKNPFSRSDGKEETRDRRESESRYALWTATIFPRRVIY